VVEFTDFWEECIASILGQNSKPAKQVKYSKISENTSLHGIASQKIVRIGFVPFFAVFATDLTFWRLNVF
jgi:hypothetical protein